MDFRVGFGYDVHRFSPRGRLMLGGVHIPYEKGLQGHSDADVLIHAMMDALLGAAGLRDIGFYFPDTDAALEGADSKLLLAKVVEMLQQNGFTIGNIDCTICLQKPKISGHIPAMLQTLSGLLGLAPGQLSIKATTTEYLGFVGREEGAAAYAVALIKK
ncbi:MAG: 2-C-methyl-D-erythritol 2,4-cyclodiphosphate synthase [Bacteroidales bacterium]